jgi:hypothetical protein
MQPITPDMSIKTERNIGDSSLQKKVAVVMNIA